MNVLKYLFFLMLGIGLMLFAAKKVHLQEVLLEASKMNFSFFLYSAIMALLAHFSRAVRWRYLIRSFGFNPKLKNVFLSVLFMYFSNLIIPRSGEVARCGTLYKYEKIPVKNLLGTVVVERLFDLLTLVFATLMLLALQLDTVRGIYSGSSLPDLVSSLLRNRFMVLSALLSIVLFVVVIFLWRKKILGLKIFKKVPGFIQEVRSGFKKVLNLENKVAFLGHTLFIWLMYFLMTYVCFFAYPPTSDLGLSAGFAVFMAGSFGMVAPTNGGIGAWHLMVGLALSFFGVSDENGVAITQVAFATMTGAVIFFGAVAVIILPFVNKKAVISASEAD
jgi:glycosyltransferase 2 family protein